MGSGPQTIASPGYACQALRGGGAVAQLVAHLHGMEGVRGSNPLSSTRGASDRVRRLHVRGRRPPATRPYVRIARLTIARMCAL